MHGGELAQELKGLRVQRSSDFRKEEHHCVTPSALRPSGHPTAAVPPPRHPAAAAVHNHTHPHACAHATPALHDAPSAPTVACPTEPDVPDFKPLSLAGTPMPLTLPLAPHLPLSPCPAAADDAVAAAAPPAIRPPPRTRAVCSAPLGVATSRRVHARARAVPPMSHAVSGSTSPILPLVSGSTRSHLPAPSRESA